MAGQGGDLVEKAGTAGFAAKGVLYIVIAAIAGQVAAFGGGSGGSGQASQSGAIEALSDSGWGTAVLVLLAIGLAGYALLRLAHVWINPSRDDGLKGVAMRISYAARFLTYGGLTFLTVQQLAGGGGGGGGGGSTQREAIQTVLEWPGGQVLVGIGGLIGIGVGLYQLKDAVTRDFMDHVRGSAPTTVVEILGVVGHVARAVLFATIGVLLIQAALESDASEGGGMSKAISELGSTTLGGSLVTVVAVGLAAYGAFCLALARWGSTRHVD